MRLCLLCCVIGVAFGLVWFVLVVLFDFGLRFRLDGLITCGLVCLLTFVACFDFVFVDFVFDCVNVWNCVLVVALFVCLVGWLVVVGVCCYIRLFWFWLIALFDWLLCLKCLFCLFGCCVWFGDVGLCFSYLGLIVEFCNCVYCFVAMFVLGMMRLCCVLDGVCGWFDCDWF